jgi:regulation of enolase protein 1 (concanavalin A-like superfamily)
MGFTDPVMAGLAVVSHNPAALSTATFDNVTAGPLASSLPAPWSHSDVGAPAVPGSASYAGGVFTVTGAGADIWSSTRQFHLVSQPLSGDFTITARVTSQADTDPWAKAGIVIGQSLTGAGPYALLAVTPGNGITFQYNGNSSVSGGGYAFPDAWLRLTRSGTTITAYASADGTTWTTVGTATIGFTDPVLVGLAVCAHAAAALSTADFDNVTITVPAPDVTPAQFQGPLPQAPILAPS